MSNHCTIYAEMHMIFDNDFDVHSIAKQLGIAPTECKSRNETRISPLTNNPTLNSRVRKKSSPVRGTWIEICPVRSISPAGKSSPVRGRGFRQQKKRGSLNSVTIAPL